MPSTSQELLPIVVQGNKQLVDASLLHRKLKSFGRYYDWINYRIKEYGFKESEDFFMLKKVQHIGPGKPSNTFYLTLDMAKELAMLEKNETGRAIRRYFIAKEKELRAVSQLPQQPDLFRGLKPRNINGRKMYPYQAIRERCGYSIRSSSAGHRHRYPGHFILNGRTLLITSEFSLHLFRQKQVLNNRVALREMQPVLPFNFGNPLLNN